MRLKSVGEAVRKGLLIPVGDGRYCVNRGAVRRRDYRLLTGAALVLAAITAAVLLL